MTAIEHQKEFGEINFPDQFLEKLVEKTIEEQAEFFRITESSRIAKTS